MPNDEIHGIVTFTRLRFAARGDKGLLTYLHYYRLNDVKEDGMDDPMKKAQFLTKLLAGARQNHFRMEWEGSKIPRGATINGVEIGWTQHGMVTGKDGVKLGHYEREVEFGGGSGSKQVIIISTNHSEVTPPPGGTVEPVAREIGHGAPPR